MRLLDAICARLGRRQEAQAAPSALPPAQAAVPVLTASEPADTPAARVLREAIDPALQILASYGVARIAPARQMLLAIAGQEAGWTARRQMGGGPARGLWQFERGGGVVGVLSHPASQHHAARLCAARGVMPVAPEVWVALEGDDILAAGIARLLLLTDPAPLPEDEAAGWAVYLRCWRPGKPHPDRWPRCWQTAREVIGA